MDRADIQNAVVRVVKRGGGIAGTGFFVAPDVVLTCAHVIREAGASPQDGAISLRWGAKKTMIEGDVDPASWREQDAGDIALIKTRRPMPAGAVVARIAAWNGTKPSALLGLGFSEAEGIWTNGTVVGGEGFPDPQGVRFLQIRSEEIEPGFSGGPLFDEARGCVVAMIRARLAEGATVAFGLSTEMIAELLVAKRGSFCETAVTDFIEQVSATVLPRAAWPGGRAVEQAPPAAAVLDPIAACLARCPALSAERARLLLRLPAMRTDLVSVSAEACARAIIEALATRVDGLALAVAAVWELDGGIPTTIALDRLVQSALHRTHSEKTLRAASERVARVDAADLQRHVAELAPGIAVDGRSHAQGHEAIWSVRFVSNLRPVGGRSPLEALLERLEAPVTRVTPVTPVALAPEPADCALLVAVEQKADRYTSRIWAVAGSKKKKLHDDGGVVGSLEDVGRHIESCWERLADLQPVVPSETTVEFILPRSMMCHDVENWRVRFGRRPHPLAGRCRVVVRSWERLFDPSLRSTWGSWNQKWNQRLGPLHWLEQFARERSEQIFDRLGQPEISGVALEFSPEPHASGEHDVLSMFIDAGIPIAVWLRDPGARPAMQPKFVPDDAFGAAFEHAPEWVRQKRAAAFAGDEASLGRCVTLMYDSFDRLPPDLEIARENVTRKVEE